jgi:aspartate-semialdehyde dehydrogenase
MEHEHKVGVVGATGAVGRALIEILTERKHHFSEVRLAASENSVGQTIEIRGVEKMVDPLSEDFFDGLQVVFFCAGSSISQKWAPVATQAGCWVIDNSSFYRQDPDVPLVVPEVNGFDLEQAPTKGIVANPNCTTIGLLTAMAPIHAQIQLKHMVVSTYQSVSGAGQKGIDELSKQVISIFNYEDAKTDVFNQRIAFNLIPQIGPFDGNGDTQEELKMKNEAQKMLHAPKLQVDVTSVRVPTFVGHAMTVYATSEENFELAELQEALSTAPGVTYLDAPDKGVFPVLTDAQAKDDVYVGRLRKGSQEKSFQAWLVSDNLRKGAALNAVQIFEVMAARSWFKN